GCDKGLSLAGFHLRDFAAMEHHAAHQLHIEMPLSERAFGGLAHRGEGLGQDIVQILAVGQPFAKLNCLRTQRLIRKEFEFRLTGIDWRTPRVEAFHPPVVGTAENLGCESAKRNHGSRASLPRFEYAVRE